MALIQLAHITKRYFIGTPNELTVLDDMNLSIDEGEFTAIVGPSGSGKSTLMNIIGVLDRPTEGRYVLDGLPIDQVPDQRLSMIRNQKIGFVFQSFNLIPRTSALSNVELPMLYARVGQRERRRRAAQLLRTVHMDAWAAHMPNELSGGQCQRVAIARAMANDPPIILADEPTGALDTHTGRMVMDIFHELHEKQHKTIVLITHNDDLAEEAERIITIEDGRITGERAGRAARPAADATKVVEVVR
ncbi:ABC transporter ATP-binding protein [uncultured Pseudoramibacter sp.]|jgi:putative ABC transport system ATP-binding protein|uniref:ABC transporter ATP-binding protein n=1 Tax=uncultured Pseudoramibacter sp. TaxID=1623493 RepID=UPI0025D21122|nr:ABC transporter ATP-binding protein [uncultured Pseudoramibacter sp.]